MIYLNAIDVIGIKTSNPVRQSNGEWLSKLMITTGDGRIVVTCSAENIQSLNAMVVENIWDKEDK